MIVCLCKSVSDRAIRAAAASGLTLLEVVRETGAGSDCGCCADTVARIVAEPGPCRSQPCAGCPRRAAEVPASKAA
jgi:bacterioferritin-associated ferredoxin